MRYLLTFWLSFLPDQYSSMISACSAAVLGGADGEEGWGASDSASHEPRVTLCNAASTESTSLSLSHTHATLHMSMLFNKHVHYRIAEPLSIMDAIGISELVFHTALSTFNLSSETTHIGLEDEAKGPTRFRLPKKLLFMETEHQTCEVSTVTLRVF